MTRTLLAVALLVLGLSASAAWAQEATPLVPTASASAATLNVNLNTASAAQLEELPGIGAKTAQRIIEFRQKNGPFRKVEELMNVKGIGEKSFLKLKPYLSVGAPKAEKAAGAQP